MDASAAAGGHRAGIPWLPRDRDDPCQGLERRWRVLGAAGAARSVLARPYDLDDAQRYARNVENYIGTVKVPLGIAGPLRVRGTSARGDYILPLATTEAALVASYSRGAQLLTEAGGCNAAVIAEGIGRSPGFEFDSLPGALAFARWIETQAEAFAAAAAAVTRHGRLLGSTCTVEANHVYVNFEFTTGEAAGQNMVTFATEAILRHILAHAPVMPRHAFLEANHSGDKKASARAMGKVRGKRVSAEALIPRALVEARLHTTPARMARYWRMAAVGSLLSGTIGVQGHYANGLAALYIACGQDAACVAESAVGITRMEVEDAGGGLYASVTLPNVIAGTVGGGTGLPSQRACLDLIAGFGPLDARGFAELCAALALAGELSIIGALCSGDFARAHAELARGQAREVRHA